MDTESHRPRLTRRQFLQTTGAFLLGTALLGSAGCSRPAKQSQRLLARHYDFLRHFAEAQVQAADPAAVQAGAVGHVAGQGRFGLLMSRSAQVLFPAVPVSQQARLEFGVGVLEESWEQAGSGATCLVEVVDAAGATHSLYERRLEPSGEAGDRRWFDESVELDAFAGQTVQVVFRSEGGEGGVVWSNPGLVSWEPSTAAATARPNILFITIDTLRADHLSCYGYPRQTTPNLDRLAAEGTRFTHAYSQSEITLPSHSTMFTGLHPRSHGATKNGTALPEEVVTLAELLQEQGYRTVGVPSAYVLEPELGFTQGFTDFFICRAVRRPGEEATGRAIQWLNEHPVEPYFMWVHYFDVHAPYLPESPYDGLYSAAGSYAPYHFPASGVRMPANWDGWYAEDWPPPYEDVAEIITQYDGALLSVDNQISRLLTRLEKKGQADHTIVIVTSDHGEGFGEHGVTFEHFGTHEEMLHVPLLVSYPTRLPAGQVVEEQVGHVDLMPTLLELLNLPISPEIQGISLLPLLEGRRWSGHEEGIFSQQRGGGALSVRTPDWRLIMQLVTDETWPLYEQQPGQVELYDERADPGETVDLGPTAAGEDLQMERALAKRILSWKEGTPARTGVDMTATDAELEKMLHDLGY